MLFSVTASAYASEPQQKAMSDNCTILSSEEIADLLKNLPDSASAAPKTLPDDCTALSEFEVAQFMESLEMSKESTTMNNSYNGVVSDHAEQVVDGSAHVLENLVTPLAVDLDTGTLFFHNSIFAYATYNPGSQSESLRLSTPQNQRLLNGMMSYLHTLEGSYAIVGWIAVSRIEFDASNPLYIEYTPSATWLKIGADADAGTSIKETISESNEVRAIQKFFTFPSNCDPKSEYYWIGCDGVFYYKNSSNNISQQIYFGCGAGFNSEQPTAGAVVNSPY